MVVSGGFVGGGLGWEGLTCPFEAVYNCVGCMAWGGGEVKCVASRCVVITCEGDTRQLSSGKHFRYHNIREVPEIIYGLSL